jgi:hypothetical protein
MVSYPGIQFQVCRSSTSCLLTYLIFYINGQ